MNERENKPVPAQSLHMLNSSHIQSKLENSPRLKAILDPNHKPAVITEELYLTILSRFPTPEEVQTAQAYGLPPAPPVTSAPAATTKPGKYAKPLPVKPKYVPMKKRDDWIDVAWSLINSTEFLYRH